MKKLIILLFTAFVLSSCSAKPMQQTTTTSVDTESAEAWEYEYYIEDINYYMNKYVEVLDKVVEAEQLQDYSSIRKAYKDCRTALDKFHDIVCPEPLSEKHKTFLSVVDSEKEFYGLMLETLKFAENIDELSPEEQMEFANIEMSIENWFEESERGLSLWDARNAVMEEAYSYLGWTYEQNITYIYEE